MEPVPNIPVCVSTVESLAVVAQPSAALVPLMAALLMVPLEMLVPFVQMLVAVAVSIL